MGNDVDASLLLNRHHEAQWHEDDYCTTCYRAVGYMEVDFPPYEIEGHTTLDSIDQVRRWLWRQGPRGWWFAVKSYLENARY